MTAVGQASSGDTTDVTHPEDSDVHRNLIPRCHGFFSSSRWRQVAFRFREQSLVSSQQILTGNRPLKVAFYPFTTKSPQFLPEFRVIYQQGNSSGKSEFIVRRN